jgi:hypothetical protein
MRNGLTMADRDVTEMLQRKTVQIYGVRNLSRLQRETVQIHGVRKLSRRFEAGRQAGSFCKRNVS